MCWLRHAFFRRRARKPSHHAVCECLSVRARSHAFKCKDEEAAKEIKFAAETTLKTHKARGKPDKPLAELETDEIQNIVKSVLAACVAAVVLNTALREHGRPCVGGCILWTMCVCARARACVCCWSSYSRGGMLAATANPLTRCAAPHALSRQGGGTPVSCRSITIRLRQTYVQNILPSLWTDVGPSEWLVPSALARRRALRGDGSSCHCAPRLTSWAGVLQLVVACNRNESLPA